MNQRIVIAGASGLIGSALTEALQDEGYDVHTLVRRKPEHAKEYLWNPDRGVLDAGVLRDTAALISLSGASVGKIPWTASYRRLLRSSRISSTRTLAHAVKSLGDEAPEAWLSASASGFYGSQPGKTLTEASSVGQTFLAKLCADWEAEALAAQEVTRVTLLRTAPVIHPDAVLKPMMKLTKLGLGGPLAGGRQHWPWISLTDEVRGIVHALKHKLVGPVNLTGPTIATANEIGRELARQMHRPFLVPAPKFALNLALGRDAAESLLTSDAAVLPTALLESGFEFTYETPAEAISQALER